MGIHQSNDPTDFRNRIINKNIATAWRILGPEFADAYKWASVVNHSESKG